MATTSTKDKTCYKLNDGARYALLEIPASGSTFTLSPTDSNYRKITLTVIDDSYSSLYYEALKVYAQYIGEADAGSKEKTQQRIEWVDDAKSISIVYPEGTYTVSPTEEQDVFEASRYSLLEFLNQKIDSK